jgi:hypothetical protein
MREWLKAVDSERYSEPQCRDDVGSTPARALASRKKFMKRKTKAKARKKIRRKMKNEINEIEINGEIYVKKSEVSQNAPEKDGMKYCIVRTYSAGVFAGYVESRNGQEVVMRDARRIFYWDGAASLSQLAMSGTSKPQNCKFPEAVDRVELLQAIEILDVTEKAQKSIASVGIWKC